MKLRALIAKGVASNKTEALRMAITAYERQIEEEEEKELVERLSEDEARWKEKKLRTKSLDDVLKENRISRKSL